MSKISNKQKENYRKWDYKQNRWSRGKDLFVKPMFTHGKALSGHILAWHDSHWIHNKYNGTLHGHWADLKVGYKIKMRGRRVWCKNAAA